MGKRDDLIAKYASDIKEKCGMKPELLSNLVFEVCWSCGDLTGLRFFNSVFEPDACDDFWEVLEAS